MRPFVVTGTGRCGTRWISGVLRALGYPCGHERVFTPTSIEDGSWRARLDRWSCDASWLAVAVDLPPDVLVLHQLRDPLDVARSLYGIGLLHPAVRDSNSYARLLVRLTSPPADEAAACLHVWRVLNELIADRKPDLTYRVEALDASLLGAIVDLIDPGHRHTARDLERAIRDAGDRNSRPRAELPPDHITDELRRAAARFGYR